MSIKDKIKSIWEKARAKNKTAAKSSHKNADAELAADEVIEHEVFPDKTPNPSKAKAKAARPTKDSAGKTKCAKTNNSAKKPASKRSRPTNYGYEMIDPDNNTVDTGKS